MSDLSVAREAVAKAGADLHHVRGAVFTEADRGALPAVEERFDAALTKYVAARMAHALTKAIEVLDEAAPGSVRPFVEATHGEADTGPTLDDLVRRRGRYADVSTDGVSQAYPGRAGG